MLERIPENLIMVRTSEKIYEIMQPILKRCGNDRKKENLWCMGLDSSYSIQYVELISVGDTVSTKIDPKQIFSHALRERVSSIVLIHNHPETENESLLPSEADILATENLVQLSTMLNIEFMDHLIINERSYFSFFENGMLLE